MHPSQDPNQMPLYHVQLETRDLIVSYEVATKDFDQVEVATAHLRQRLRDPHVQVHHKGGGSIGYHPRGDGRAVVVEWTVAAGNLSSQGE